MTGKLITVDGEPFLNRFEEQTRFREVLSTVLSERKAWKRIQDWLEEKEPPMPFVFLIHGEGGIGKTMLAKRFRDIASRDRPFKNKFCFIRLDWLVRKDIDYRLKLRDSISPETIYDHIYKAFSNKGFSTQFERYVAAVNKRSQAENKVDHELSKSIEEGDPYKPILRSLGAKGLAWLVRNGATLIGGTPIPIPEEPMAEAFTLILEGGAVAIEKVYEKAVSLAQNSLPREEFDLFKYPNETLAQELAHGIHRASADKSIILILDTYEIVDRPDSWLRVVIKQSGPQVVWVIAGRNRLDRSRRFGKEHFTGYRDEFSFERLRVFPIGAFSPEDVALYFSERAPQRPLNEKEAEEIHKAVFGIPLAVREAADLWRDGVPLQQIIGNIPSNIHRKRIVNLMTERFLNHLFIDPDRNEHKLRLFALTLAYKPDAKLLKSMLQSQDLESVLIDLERHYSFVFVSEMKLHEAVNNFLSEYLLQDLHRNSEEVTNLNKRAISYLNEQKVNLEDSLQILEDRIGDNRWADSKLSLTHHCFWIDEDEGWNELLSAFIGGLVYDKDFSRALLEIANFFQPTFSRKSKACLKALNDGLSSSADPGKEEKLLNAIDENKAKWSKGDCTTECSAIISLKRGQLKFKHNQFREALTYYQETEGLLPEQGSMLKAQLAECYFQIGLAMGWDKTSGYAIPSQDAETALKRAIQLEPEAGKYHVGLGIIKYGLKKYKEAVAEVKNGIAQGEDKEWSHNWLGNIYSRWGRYKEAISEYKQAVQLNPSGAAPHNGLGIVFWKLDRLEEAIEEFQRAIQLDPNYAIAHNGLGIIYRYLSRYDEAIIEYQQAIEINRKDASTHNGLGNVYFELERYEEAEAEYTRAIEIDKHFYYPYNNLAEIHLIRNEIDQAYARFNERIRENPSDALNAFVSNGIIALHRDDPEYTDYLKQASDVWENTGKHKPISSARILENIALVHLCSGEHEEALNTMKACIKQRLPGDKFIAIRYELIRTASNPPDGIDEMIKLLQDADAI